MSPARSEAERPLRRLAKLLPVLVDEDVWPEFGDAITGLGGRWTAPSGRVYALVLEGHRLQVDLVLDDLGPHPSGDEIDADLLELACVVVDAVGGEWNSQGLRTVAQVWRTGELPGQPG